MGHRRVGGQRQGGRGGFWMWALGQACRRVASKPQRGLALSPCGAGGPRSAPPSAPSHPPAGQSRGQVAKAQFVKVEQRQQKAPLCAVHTDPAVLSARPSWHGPVQQQPRAQRRPHLVPQQQQAGHHPQPGTHGDAARLSWHQRSIVHALHCGRGWRWVGVGCGVPHRWVQGWAGSNNWKTRRTAEAHCGGPAEMARVAQPTGRGSANRP